MTAKEFPAARTMPDGVPGAHGSIWRENEFFLLFLHTSKRAKIPLGLLAAAALLECLAIWGELAADSAENHYSLWFPIFIILGALTALSAVAPQFACVLRVTKETEPRLAHLLDYSPVAPGRVAVGLLESYTTVYLIVSAALSPYLICSLLLRTETLPALSVGCLLMYLVPLHLLFAANAGNRRPEAMLSFIGAFFMMMCFCVNKNSAEWRSCSMFEQNAFMLPCILLFCVYSLALFMENIKPRILAGERLLRPLQFAMFAFSAYWWTHEQYRELPFECPLMLAAAGAAVSFGAASGFQAREIDAMRGASNPRKILFLLCSGRSAAALFPLCALLLGAAAVCFRTERYFLSFCSVWLAFSACAGFLFMRFARNAGHAADRSAVFIKSFLTLFLCGQIVIPVVSRLSGNTKIYEKSPSFCASAPGAAAVVSVLCLLLIPFAARDALFLFGKTRTAPSAGDGSRNGDADTGRPVAEDEA